MAKKVTINTEANEHPLQNINQPWGGTTGDSAETIYNVQVPANAEWGMNRGEVEHFIKEKLGESLGKYGYIDIPLTKFDDGYYHLRCYLTEADYTEDPTSFVLDMPIPISTDKGVSYSSRLVTNADQNADIVVTSQSYSIGLHFTSVMNNEGDIINAGENGTLTFQRSTDGGFSWSTIGTAIIPSRNIDNNVYDQFEVGQYFVLDRKTIIRVNATYSNEAGTFVSPWVTVVTATYTNLTLESTISIHRPIQASDGVFPLGFVILGAVDKVLHVVISGATGNYTYTSDIISAATEYPSTNPWTRNESEKSVGILTHGIHSVEAWLTCNDGLGQGAEHEISSDHVINRYMVVNVNTEGADLNAPRLMLQQVQSVVTNYVRTILAKYSVWIPDPQNPTTASEDSLPISIRLTDEGETDTTYSTEYLRSDQNVVSGIVYDIDTTVQVEGEDSEYLTYLRIFRYGDNDALINFMYESIGRRSFMIRVDNSENYAPYGGAHFLLNPKNRNNNESTPHTIINQQTGAVVYSTWEGFNGLTDGWVIDNDNQKVLRVLAGGKLTIWYEPFEQLISDGEAEVTLDIDFAVRNITKEDEPILEICQMVADELLGLRMLPLEGYIKCVGQQTDDNQNFAWQEDVRTHLSITIDPSVITKSADELTWQNTLNNNTSYPLSLAKVYVNGNPYREIVYAALGVTPAAGIWCQGSGHGGIKIGCDHADVDIYEIRCYRTALSASNVLRNYIASLPTANEKAFVKGRNDITRNGRIAYDRCVEKGYRCLTLVGQDQYKLNQEKENGYACYWRIDHDLPELSGTIGKAAYIASLNGTLDGKKCLMVTPQGSTANTYWDNNEQTKVDGITYKVTIPFSKVHSDFGWSAAKSTGENCDYPMYLNGDRIEGTSYAGLTDEQKAQVLISVPDGWFDGNGWSETVAEMGMYHGQFYTCYVGGAKCTKLVNKINYASPMQSHKMGATRIYHDVMQSVTGGNSLTNNGARFSVYEESFLFFTEHPNDNGKVEFRGMGTFGFGKFDKAVFGYKSNDATFAFEGLNNNLPLCDFRVPADENVTYDPDEEAWSYNGTKSFEYGLGKTVKRNDKKYPIDANDEIFRKYVNFIYCHCTSIRYYTGTRTAFDAEWATLVDTALSDNDAKNTMAEMQKYQYWCTAGATRFQLIRYDFVNDEWVDAGTWNQANLAYTAGVRDLSVDGMTADAYTAWAGSSEPTNASLNQAFRMAIAQHAATYFSSVANVQSHLTHYNLVNFFMAGTDNCSKNTYYQYDPVSGKIWLDQDDLDSIFKTDNNGRPTKVYFLDRIHDREDFENGYKAQTDYEGSGSLLFNMIEAAYEEAGNDLRVNMRSVLSAMAGLVGATDGYNISVYGCLEKYFFKIQDYFPQVAYAEQARLRYEWPKSFGYISFGNQARGIDPITQQVGSQLESERQYMKRRLAMVASYACWGDFSSGKIMGVVGLSDSGAALSMTPTSGYIGGEYRFNVVPHQWLYPTGYADRSVADPHERVAPAEPYSLLVARTGEISGDSSVGLAASNYYRSFGNIGNMVCHNATLTVIGKRLTEFIAEPSHGNNAFAPNDISFQTPNLRKLSLHGCASIGGTKDFSSLARLEHLDVYGTSITTARIPKGGNLTYLALPATLTSLTIDGQPNIGNTGIDEDADFMLEGAAYLESIVVRGNNWVNDVIRDVLDDGFDNGGLPLLNSILLRNVNWIIDTDFLRSLLAVPNVDITGMIYVNGVVDINLAIQVLNKFPDMNESGSELTILYTQTTPINSAEVIMNVYGVNSDYISELGQYQLSLNIDPIDGNDIRSIAWSIDTSQASGRAAISDDGLLIVTKLNEQVGGVQDTQPIVITAHIVTSTKTINATFTTHLYYREAAVGDYVFYDGTWNNVAHPAKPVIGRCFVSRNTEYGWDRRMVSINRYMQNIVSHNRNDDDSTSWGPANLNDGIEGYSYPYGDGSSVKTAWYNTPIEDNGQTNYALNETNYGVEGENVTTQASIAYLKSPVLMGEEILGVGADTIVPVGKKNTLIIIRLRNNILLDNNPDMVNLLSEYTHSCPPQATTINGISFTERQEVSELLKKLKTLGNSLSSRYVLLGFPAFSYAYAYEPLDANEVPIEGVADRFKAHNWYLPSIDELARIYAIKNFQSPSPFGTFNPIPLESGPLKGYVASNESGSANCYHLEKYVNGNTSVIYLCSGYVSPFIYYGASLDGGNKQQSKEKTCRTRVLPVCTF